MKNKLLYIMLFIASSAAAQSRYDPNPRKDLEANEDCLQSRCMSFQYINNHKPPKIRVAPRYSTRVKFPRELKRCEDDTKTLEISAVVEQGGEESVVDATKTVLPFTEARVRVADSQTAGSVFKLPIVNMICDFQNGDTVLIYVSTSGDPHSIVKLAEMDGNEEPDNSALLWLMENDPSKENVPIELKRPQFRTSNGIAEIKYQSKSVNRSRDERFDLLMGGRQP